MIYVMSMNSQGNQAPRIKLDSESITRRFQDERLTPNIDAHINASDVLCGRGKSSFTHVGNRRFRDAITSAIDEYNNSESRLAKSRVVQRIVENIKGEGGRFLKRDRQTGGWIELDTKSCRDKVGHAIRDAANLIEARKEKQQRREDTFSQAEQRGKTTGLSEEEESKLPSRDDDDEIYYESLSEGKQAEVVDLEEDPFVRHINQVLGPMPQQEEPRDPLKDFLDSIGRDS